MFYYVILIIFIILIYYTSNNKIENWEDLANKKKLCFTCKDIEINKEKQLYTIENIREIPNWKKKESIYSLLPKPILIDKKLNPFQKELVPYTPCKKCIRVEINLNNVKSIKKTKNIWIFYWATKARQYNTLLIPEPSEAYDKYQNSGLVKSDNYGFVKLYLENPQPYMVEGEMSAPHVQFCYQETNKFWSSNIHTVIFFPTIGYHKFISLKKKNLAILVNTLPTDKGEIPGSIRFCLENVETTDFTKLLKKKLKKYRYRNILNLIINKNISIYQVPLIIYGKSKNSQDYLDIFNYLLKLGFYNLIKFPGGLEKWFKSQNINS